MISSDAPGPEQFTATPNRELTLEQAQDQLLQHGDIITPLLQESDLDILEHVLVQKVYEGEEKFHNVVIPLSRAIHPNKAKNVNFRGKLENGFALIQETDLDLLGRRLRRPDMVQDDALTALVGMDMTSTGRGVVGIILREVIYFRKLYTVEHEHVGRYIPPARIFGDDGKKAYEKLMGEATTRADKQAAWAIRHVLHGGGVESTRYSGRRVRTDQHHGHR